jgi:glycyl-tRNA synthetase beta chain
MKEYDDFLVEIRTEELPPKLLWALMTGWYQQIKERLEKAALAFSHIRAFATPRRLAILVQDLVAQQPSQTIERKGPARSVAFDAKGQPSPACIGFARSCGVSPDELLTIKQPAGEWVGYRQVVRGQPVTALLPALVEQAVLALPMHKRMRWGEGKIEFVRPVHAVVMLYGSDVVEATLLGCRADRVTRGHRFHSPHDLVISHASQYESLLADTGYVIADFVKRRERILQQISDQETSMASAQVLVSSDGSLLDEVTGLVEWPVVLCGRFDAKFLALPREVLVAAMQGHQRYFPVMDSQNQLLPYFITVSNIDSREPSRVVGGNERVLRARLADAAFFYAADKKERLEQRVERLKNIIFQAKLGTLYEKAQRIKQIAVKLADEIGVPAEQAERAGWLAKADLTTQMVSEFPELQGVMGGYYAEYDGEFEAVVQGLREQYMPRFAGDVLPTSSMGQILAMAERLDTLVGIFGIHHAPTSDKDPYGLRRAALGVLRIMIEKELDLDLKPLLAFVVECYGTKLNNVEIVMPLLVFMQERLRAWYQDQAVAPDVFAAVAALGLTHPLDIHKRIQAVRAFKQLAAADALNVAHKRVNNILKQAKEAVAVTIDPSFFEHPIEQVLWQRLESQYAQVTQLCATRHYEAALLQLTELRQPIDTFFADVMVMTDDLSRRRNRLCLLGRLRALFLLVADIALLQ